MSDGPGRCPERKRAIGEQLWLHYYNEALFRKGMITEDERNRMANCINARSVSASRKNCAGTPC